MITATAQVTNPNEAKLAVTIEMSVGDWKKQIEQLDKSAYPSWRVASMIRSAISGGIEHVERMREAKE